MKTLVAALKGLLLKMVKTKLATANAVSDKVKNIFALYFAICLLS